MAYLLPFSLVAALQAREVIPFAGAGVSRAVTDGAGQHLFPTWRELLAAAVQQLSMNGLPKKANRVQAALEDDDFLDAAKHARDAMGVGWFDFLKAQFDPLSERAQPASLDLARAVWRLGSPLVVTTNYDKVLRWASPQASDLREWTVSHAENLAEIQRGRLEKPAVWHLHGFVDRPKEIILTPDGYAKLYPTDSQVEADYQAASWTLRHLLTARTFLFIGFGMEEAIQQQIRWVRETFAGAGVKHFVLVRERNMETVEKELQGLSVQPVPFADFGQPLLDLLGELAAHASSGGARAASPLPPMEADCRPYLEYLRNDTAFIEIRGLQLGVAVAPRFPIGDLYIPLIDELGQRAGEMEGG
ncbi:MAG: SIR2 family protein, partial [Bryobacterales bacterium]|nr:SIR2 family protein [Bryobacterales bacterium]